VTGSGGGTDLIGPGATLVDGRTGRRLTGPELDETIAAGAADLAGLAPGAVFARAGTDVRSILRYLAAWSAGRAVALLDPDLAPATLAELVRRYRPAAVLGVDGAGEPPAGYRDDERAATGRAWLRAVDATGPAPHPDLAVLLATSGSTGDPKLVRLSRAAVRHNAHAIGESLRLHPGEVAPTSLPLFYSYGMSVLNSHLAAGASVVVIDGGVLSRDFWSAFGAHGAGSLAGVPYHYEMLARIRWKPATQPSLRTLTQAGGRMRPDLITAFREAIEAVGGGLYVMYGQTEAGPRMTTLPAEHLAGKLGSVGPALPGGRLSVVTDDGAETDRPGLTGEVIYRGPNVMMGYAEDAADLARPDECGGRLATGDLGHLDEDGYLWLTGRLKRIGKVFGIRVNLDDVERLLREYGPVAAVPAGDTVVVWSETAGETERAAMVALLAERLKLHRSGFAVRTVDRLPLLASGKVDYRSLEGM
jgi:acyl-CoA synthetase (AMP-forming)/AMP-acid ligase II